MGVVTTSLLSFEEFERLPDQPGKQESLKGDLIECLRHSGRERQSRGPNGSDVPDQVWTVSPKTRAIVVHVPGQSHVLNENENLTTPLLPGFSLPIREILE